MKNLFTIYTFLAKEEIVFHLNPYLTPFLKREIKFGSKETKIQEKN